MLENINEKIAFILKEKLQKQINTKNIGSIQNIGGKRIYSLKFKTQ